MGWESFDVARFDLEPLLQGQTRAAKPKSAYNLFIVASGGYFGLAFATPPPPPPRIE